MLYWVGATKRETIESDQHHEENAGDIVVASSYSVCAVWVYSACVKLNVSILTCRTANVNVSPPCDFQFWVACARDLCANASRSVNQGQQASCIQACLYLKRMLLLQQRTTVLAGFWPCRDVGLQAVVVL